MRFPPSNTEQRSDPLGGPAAVSSPRCLCLWCIPLGFDGEKQPERLGLGRVTKYKNSHTCGLGPQAVSEVLLQGIFWDLHCLSHGTSVWNNRSQGKAQESF